MSSLNYPSSSLKPGENNSHHLNQCFDTWVLNTRVWLMRVLFIAVGIATVWRYSLGLPIYAPSLQVAAGININTMVFLLTTFRWKNYLPIQHFVTRLGVIVSVLTGLLILVANAGIPPLWSFGLALIGVVILLDDPDISQYFLRRWCGTLIALCAVFFALLNIPLEQWQQDPILQRRINISLITIVCVTSYVWHYHFYLNKLICGADDYASPWWQQKVASIVQQFKFVNPLIIIISIVVILITGGFSLVIVFPESSFFYADPYSQKPLITWLSTCILALLLISLAPSIKRWVSYFFYGFLLITMVWGLVFFKSVGNTLLYCAAFIFLQFYQPKGVRWTAGIVCLGAVIAQNFLDDSNQFDEEKLVLATFTLVAAVLIFDRLRQVQLYQLSLLENLAYEASLGKYKTAIQPNSKSSPLFSSRSELAFFSGALLIILAITGYYSMIMSEQRKLDVFSEQLTIELDEAQHELLNQLTMSGRLVTAGYSDVGFNRSWCAVLHNGLAYPNQSMGADCHADLNFYINNTSKLIPNTLYLHWTHHSPLMLLRVVDDNNLETTLVVSLTHWLKDILKQQYVGEDIHVLVALNSADESSLGEYDVQNSTLNLASTSESNGLKPLTLSVRLSIGEIVFERFWFGLLQLSGLLLLVILMIWQAYRNRSKYVDASSALVLSEKQLGENQALRQELSNALHRAEQANKSKDQFFTMIGHEIRTPLNSIMGMLQALNLSELNDHDQRKLNNAYLSASLLLNLVNDILDFSRAQTASLTITKRAFDLRDLVSSIKLQMEILATKKGLTLTFNYPSDSSLELLGDDIRLSQVLTNLLNNAIKFTSQGEVTLTVETFASAIGRSCKFSVSDTGPGIDEAFISELFLPFTQADMSETRPFRGVGLGLSIVKSIVDAMDGKIEVYTKLGQGTTFVVVIDFEVSHTEQVIKRTSQLDFEAPDQDIYQGCRILAVDDDPINLEVIGDLLEPLGVVVDVAETAQEVNQLLDKHGEQYCFVLMDHQMPHMTGLEQSHRIRENYSAEQLPIILLTADLSNKVIDLSALAGINESLAKPVTMSMLVRLINTYFQPNQN